jgi:hypothetical protein
MEDFSLVTEALTQAATRFAADLPELGQEAVQDAYTALKGAIRSRFGIKHDLPEAVEQLEKRPDSTARQAVVDEEVRSAGADEVPELRELARALLEIVQSAEAGSSSSQTATGSNIAQAMGPGASAKVNVRR